MKDTEEVTVATQEAVLEMNVDSRNLSLDNHIFKIIYNLPFAVKLIVLCNKLGLSCAKLRPSYVSQPAHLT